MEIGLDLSLLSQDWTNLMEREMKKEYFHRLMDFLSKEELEYVVFPKKEDRLHAFCVTPLHKVKVVILGQDPYHNENQSHGLCFSVKPGVKIPPSLVNIYKELNTDLGYEIPNHGYLEHWAEQGVLLLNTVLTVRAHEANSHKGKGWETFTDAILEELNSQDRPIVFILWGSPAQQKKKLLNNPMHHILEAPHPSPLSSYRGFFGSKPFSKANELLQAQGVEPVDWCI